MALPCRATARQGLRHKGERRQSAMEPDPERKGEAVRGGRVGIRDVARRAGVAISSVSRVLNGNPNVTPALRQRVLEAVEALGYQVNLVGSDLRRGTTRTVGVVIDDIANPLFAEIMLGAEATLSAAGYLVTLMSSHGTARGDAAALRHFRGRRVDGLLLALSDDTGADWHAALAAGDGGCPVVLLDREAPLPCHSVLSDHAQGMDAALTELVGAGHRRIGLMLGPLCTRPGRARLRAFEAGLRARGLNPDARFVTLHTPATAADAERTMAGVLRRPAADRPSAMIVGGGQLLTGALRALHAAGCRLPEEMSLLVCDDTPLAELHRPGLTALRRDVIGIGRAGAELLLEAMKAPGAEPRSATIPIEIVRRASVGPPAA